MVLHGHPFSSYCQKVTIAFYETGTRFDFKLVESAADFEALKQLWPLGLMPVLVDDGGTTVVESSIIIDYATPQLIPDDGLEVRFLDRFFDNYVMTPMQKVVIDRLRPEAERDARGVADARARLQTAYAWLESRLEGRSWAAGGDSFTLADCAAAPSLFYADWTERIGEQFPTLRAYRARLLAHPSVKRAVDEARPYRAGFPLGAPDRD
jgi:glutathione S-transferase